MKQFYPFLFFPEKISRGDIPLQFYSCGVGNIVNLPSPQTTLRLRKPIYLYNYSGMTRILLYWSDGESTALSIF